jgi:pimeloyl-ACP methyl ester carboxylesterase
MAETRMPPQAGHWIQQEQPDGVNAALIAFLGQTTTTG